MGFQRAVIAGLEPLMSGREFLESWLSRDYAAGMEYLKRNPHFRTSPALLYPGAKSAIVVSASYYSERPPQPSGGHFGRVARYAVGRDYHAAIRGRLRKLKESIEAQIGRALSGKAFTDDVALFEPAFAARWGVGFIGKNSLVIAPGLTGTYHFLGELLSDLPLAPDEPYEGTCAKCVRCVGNCPTGAIVESFTVDARRCISYLTIENKGGIPLDLRTQLGSWVFGCDACQEVCPYNQAPPRTTWAEFQPEMGAGHYLDLFSLLTIATEEEFRARFELSPLRRPKRRGLTRNALVVLGNQRPDGGIEAMRQFAAGESDPMLREHAAWAIARYKELRAKAALESLIARESDDLLRQTMSGYLEEI